jgi:hypothetical protein
MEALVDESLGKIDRAEPVGEAFVREDRFMHARSASGERRVEHVFEAPQNVIGVQHGIFGDLLQSVRAVAQDVSESPG